MKHRRERIARILAKRPREPRVRARFVEPDQRRFDSLVDLLVEMLESRRHSGQG